MHKSKAHFRVKHNGLITAVPVSYFASFQSRDGISQVQAISLALAEALNRKISEGENPSVDTSEVIDATGTPITEDTFTVHEHASGFSLTHNPSGKNHWLSDGVDALSDGVDNTLHPGTIGFTELWTEEMNSDPEALEAYFPELLDTAMESVRNNKQL
jgi:hypothetical protein